MDPVIEEPFDTHGRSAAAQRYLYARKAMDEGRTKEALSLFLKAAEDQPHFKTYELIGECYMREARSAAAIPYLAAATMLNRGVRAPALLSEAWLSLGEYRQAVEAADVALLRDPKNRKSLEAREKATLAAGTTDTGNCHNLASSQLAAIPKDSAGG